ncbi:MAG TPA: TraB/GumN family protein [archaeon]|nr:TraB/GumN family protein [archaeon]
MIEKLSLAGKQIILVGTAHISSESIELVKKTIEEENPDAVGVELDSQRLEQLKSGSKWRETNVEEILKAGKSHLFLVNLMLSNMQKKFGDSVGIQPGSEMLAAVSAAEEKKIPVELLDRDIKITMKRSLASMGLREKAKLGYSVLEGFFADEKITKEQIEELKKKDLLSEVMQELSKSAPTIKKVLVDERDEFIARKILASPAKKIVAVVGAGHLEGVARNLKSVPVNVEKGKNEASPSQNFSISTHNLEIIPEKKSFMKYFAWAIPILLLALIGYGFYAKGLDAILRVGATWILVTGGLSAIAVLLARGHILSALTAFVAAPITTIHPALASGWFAALAEAKLNTPKVKDFESLRELKSVGDFFTNRVTKILLVAAFSNLGSMIGVFIALPMVAGVIS